MINSIKGGFDFSFPNPQDDILQFDPASQQGIDAVKRVGYTILNTIFPRLHPLQKKSIEFQVNVRQQPDIIYTAFGLARYTDTLRGIIDYAQERGDTRLRDDAKDRLSRVSTYINSIPDSLYLRKWVSKARNWIRGPKYSPDQRRMLRADLMNAGEDYTDPNQMQALQLLEKPAYTTRGLHSLRNSRNNANNAPNHQEWYRFINRRRRPAPAVAPPPAPGSAPGPGSGPGPGSSPGYGPGFSPGFSPGSSPGISSPGINPLYITAEQGNSTRAARQREEIERRQRELDFNQRNASPADMEIDTSGMTLYPVALDSPPLMQVQSTPINQSNRIISAALSDDEPMQPVDLGPSVPPITPDVQPPGEASIQSSPPPPVAPISPPVNASPSTSDLSSSIQSPGNAPINSSQEEEEETSESLNTLIDILDEWAERMFMMGNAPRNFGPYNKTKFVFEDLYNMTDSKDKLFSQAPSPNDNEVWGIIISACNNYLSSMNNVPKKTKLETIRNLLLGQDMNADPISGWRELRKLLYNHKPIDISKTSKGFGEVKCHFIILL